MNYSDLKIGKLAHTVMKQILEDGRADEAEVNCLQQAGYSKDALGIQFPALVRVDGKYDKTRYYADPVVIRGVEYRLCSQWYETPTNNDRPLLEAWINRFEGTGVQVTSKNASEGIGDGKVSDPSNGSNYFDFDGEYYLPCSRRTVTIYKDKVYYLDSSRVYVYESKKEKEFIIDRIKTHPMHGSTKGDYTRIYANDKGIFLYYGEGRNGGGVDRGDIIAHYSFSGDLLGTLSVSCDSQVNMSGYFVDYYFDAVKAYAITSNKLFIYHTENRSTTSYTLNIPTGDVATRLVVNANDIFIRGEKNWYCIELIPAAFGFESCAIFKNPIKPVNENEQIYAFFPKKKVFWTMRNDSDSSAVFKEYDYVHQCYTGRSKEFPIDDLRYRYVLTFDGNFMLVTRDCVGRMLQKIDFNGKTEIEMYDLYFFDVLDKLLINDGHVFANVDHYDGHYYMEADMATGEMIRKICQRV